jgi:hypothetical protein
MKSMSDELEELHRYAVEWDQTVAEMRARVTEGDPS